LVKPNIRSLVRGGGLALSFFFLPPEPNIRSLVRILFLAVSFFYLPFTPNIGSHSRISFFALSFFFFRLYATYPGRAFFFPRSARQKIDFGGKYVLASFNKNRS